MLERKLGKVFWSCTLYQKPHSPLKARTFRLVLTSSNDSLRVKTWFRVGLELGLGYVLVRFRLRVRLGRKLGWLRLG